MRYAVAVGVVWAAIAGCSFGVRTVAYDEQPAQEAVAAFLDHLVDGDHDAAYALLTEESKSHTTSAEFRASREAAEGDGRGITRYELLTPVSPVQGADPEEALSVPTRLTFEDGTSSDLAFEVRNEGGHWRLQFSEE